MHRLSSYVKFIIFGFLAWKALSYIFAYLATFISPLQISFVTDAEYRFAHNYFIWIWGNFDGFHYMSISKYGYALHQHAFFPLYPLMITWLKSLLILFTDVHRLIIGQLLSNGMFFLSLFIMYKLAKLDKYKMHFLLLLLVVLTFPTSFFYGAVYNDAPFLLFALLTIYYARKKRWVLSSLFGGLATLTRLNGLVLGFLILLEYLTQNDSVGETWQIKRIVRQVKIALSPRQILASKIFALVLIPLSFLSFLAYVHYMYGDWQLVFRSMEAWGQDKLTFPLQVFWRYLKIMLRVNPLTITYWVAMLELSSVLFYIAMMVYGLKKIRLSYWLFFTISILIPSLTGTFQGMPRYGLHLYPFFLTVALFLEKKSMRTKVLYFALSLVLFLLCLTLFTRGYFVA